MVEVAFVRLIDAAAVAAIDAFDEAGESCVARLDDAQVGFFHDDGAIGEADDGGISAYIVLADLFAVLRLARMGDDDDVRAVAQGEALEGVAEAALGGGFFIGIGEGGHHVIEQKEFRAISARGDGEDLEDGVGLVGVEDFLIVVDEEVAAQPIEDAGLHVGRDDGDFLALYGVVFEGDPVRACGLQAYPFLKFLLGEFAGVGADVIALFDGIEKEHACCGAIMCG